MLALTLVCLGENHVNDLRRWDHLRNSNPRPLNAGALGRVTRYQAPGLCFGRGSASQRGVRSPASDIARTTAYRSPPVSRRWRTRSWPSEIQVSRQHSPRETRSRRTPRSSAAGSELTRPVPPLRRGVVPVTSTCPRLLLIHAGFATRIAVAKHRRKGANQVDGGPDASSDRVSSPPPPPGC
jgi:hypothetical protein